MVKKIYQAICLVAALVLVCSTGLMTAVLYNRFSEQVQRELHVETVYIAYGLETQGESYLEGMKDQTRRITHIAADGTVLFDNAADSSAMENHLDREEVREALETGSGEGSRSSAKFKDVVEQTNGRVVPLWLEADKANFAAKVVRMPGAEDLDYETQTHLIVELYSK